MGYHIRVECADVASLQTTRTRNSELWFVNNNELESAILGYLARYVTRYEVDIYAFAPEGTHIHNVSMFPKANRSHFMRDFNSSVARAVDRYQKDYPGGGLWGRRYSAEPLVGNPDVEDYFFYTVLQPVNDGLVNDISEYPDYNCFEDAVTGRARQYTVVNWKKYHDARRWNKSVSVDDYTDTYTLTYKRLPGYEKLSQDEYAKLMREKLAERTAAILEKRGHKPPLGANRLKQVVPGSLPKNTKTSGPLDHRPRVLSKDPVRRGCGKDWYFKIQVQYKEASARFRAGELDVEFPKGTYRPPLFTVAREGPIPLY